MFPGEECPIGRLPPSSGLIDRPQKSKFWILRPGDRLAIGVVWAHRPKFSGFVDHRCRALPLALASSDLAVNPPTRKEDET